jgi:diaminopimelate epimerase
VNVETRGALDFVKVQGTGNDFVLVDGRDVVEWDWGQLASRLCDRHFGIGSDGLLLVLPSEKADFEMRMWNPDGSESEMCGNGIRCFGKYVFDRGLVRRTEFSVSTLAGIKQLVVHPGHDGIKSVTVSMGAPELHPDRIPIAVSGERVIDHPLKVASEYLEFTGVSMGNPHAVTFIDRPVRDFPLEQIGPLVERHPLFPRRVNFEICQIVGRDEIDARVWERGAGLTLACGTGACAVAVASRLKGFTGDRVRVNLPGGTLELSWDGNGDVELTGPAEIVFTGTWQGQL